MSTGHDVWGRFSEAEWEAAQPWKATLEGIVEKRDVWRSYDRRSRVGPEARHRLENLPGPRRVLVLTEAWCGDAARAVPALAAAFAAAPQVEDKYLSSDAVSETLDRYLSHGGRAIPLAIVHDEAGTLLGVWGPRPAPLQAMLRTRKQERGSPTADTMAEWYAPIMAWYGKDAGRTTIDEILMLLERGGAPR